jgi:hypothetical protein
MITLFKYNTNEIRAIINPDSSSQESKGIMADHLFNLNFKSTEFIDFQIGDYANIFDTLFRLNKDAEFDKIWKRDYDFTLTMEGPTYELRRAQYLTLNANNHFTDGKFSLHAKPVVFLQLLIDNMNRAFPGLGWELGSVLDADYQTIEFDGNKCLQVLNTLADRFKTEYIIEGRRIHLIKRRLSSGIVLEFGKKKPLYAISRKNQDANDIITRLYAFGSSKNIGNNYRGGAPRLRMRDELFVERNRTEHGLYEDTVVFDGTNGLPDIYPHRTGIVSSVTTPFIFTDIDIDFDVNVYKLPGNVAPKITFNTGLLAGVVFEMDVFDYDTKSFTIKSNTSDQTVELPSESFTPAIGDEYVITDVTQPAKYIERAEDDLKAAAIAYLEDHGPNRLSFPVTCNPFYFNSHPEQIKLGNTVQLLAPEMNINREIRIFSYTRNYRNPDLYTMELAENVKDQPVILKLINTR